MALTLTFTPISILTLTPIPVLTFTLRVLCTQIPSCPHNDTYIHTYRVALTLTPRNENNLEMIPRKALKRSLHITSRGGNDSQQELHDTYTDTYCHTDIDTLTLTFILTLILILTITLTHIAIHSGSLTCLLTHQLVLLVRLAVTFTLILTHINIAPYTHTNT